MARAIGSLAVVALATMLASRAAAQPAVERTSDVNAGARIDPPDATLDPLVADPLVFGAPTEIFDPSGQCLAPFHVALRRAADGEGQARVMFYGASHVASDLFTNVLRARLQSRFGDAGHGFVMPARPWPHYRHLGISVESNRGWRGLRIRANDTEVAALGLGGMAVEGQTAGTWGRIDTGTMPASRFEIFYWRRPDGGSFDVFLDGQRVRRVSTASTEFGGGYALVTATDARHVLEVRLRGDGPVRLFGASVEREAAGVIVDNLGINGARASSQLLWDEALHREHLRRRDPHLVVLAYGTNEVGDDDHPIDDYETILRSVVARVRSTVPQAACMLVGPSDRPLRMPDGTLADRPRTAQVVDVQRRVARDFGCGFFDLVAFGGGPLSTVRWAATEPAYAQRDLVHYTARGYERLGEEMLASLMRGFELRASAHALPPAVASGPPR